MERRYYYHHIEGKFILVAILASVASVKAQTCLHTNNGKELGMYFRDYRYTNVEDDTIGRGHQAIIPSYNFTCSGYITGWAVDVHKGGGTNSGFYTLDLQVWRPSPTVDDSTGTGCYSLVGNNRFTSVILENQVAKVTPLPEDCCIRVQRNDVLGFFVDNPNNEKNGVVAIDDPTVYSKDIVWYGDIRGYTPSDSECPYPVGSQIDAILNTMRGAAPVISLTMTDVCCLPEPTETSSTSNPGSTSTSGNENTIGPTTDSQITSSSSQSNTTPKASDDTTNMDKFTEAQADPSRPGESLIAALTGGIMGAMLLIIVVVIGVASFAICMKSGKCNREKAEHPSASSPAIDDDDLSTNYNYGIPMHPGVDKYRYSENVYDTPHAALPPSAVEKTVETKRNEAYNITLVTVDEVAKPAQGHTSLEYDYIQ